MTDKFTESPWTCDEPDEHGDYNICGPTGLAVAVCVQNGFVPKPETEANARLIAAAPDLLEVMTFVEAYMKTLKGSEAFLLKAMVRDVISQATQD